MDDELLEITWTLTYYGYGHYLIETGTVSWISTPDMWASGEPVTIEPEAITQ